MPDGRRHRHKCAGSHICRNSGSWDPSQFPGRYTNGVSTALTDKRGCHPVVENQGR